MGPKEGTFNSVEFGTSVFKRKTEYPVGRLMLEKLPAWMRIVVAFVLAVKAKGSTYLFEQHDRPAASIISEDISRINSYFGLHLNVESHALKRGTVSVLEALKYE